MKKTVFIASLIFVIFHSESIYSQHIKVVDSININEKYKSISESDTIKIVIYESNCVGCIKDKIIFFYRNNVLNVVFEDSFITKVQIADEVSSADTIRLFSILKKSEKNNKIKKRDYHFLEKMVSNGSFKSVQLPLREKLFLYDIGFDALITEIESIETLFKKTNLKIYEKYKVNMVSFDITNQDAISYFSNIDAKEYILKVVLSGLKPIR